MTSTQPEYSFVVGKLSRYTSDSIIYISMASLKVGIEIFEENYEYLLTLKGDPFGIGRILRC